MQCPQCGRPAGDADRFCGQCGYPFATGEPSPVAPPTGEPPLSPSPPPVNPPHNVPWGLKEVALGIALAIIGLVAVAVVSIGAAQISFAYRTAIIAWASSNLLGVALLAIVLLLGPIRHRRSLRTLGLLWPPRLTPLNLAFTGAVIAGSLGFTAAYAYLMRWLGVEQLTPPEIPYDVVFPGLGAIATLQALAVVTPITEELFFRGFVFAGLMPRLGTRRAMLASALIFSVFHFQLGVIIPITVTGLLFAWLYHRTNSIWPTVLAHAAQNGLAVIATIYATRPVV